MRDAAITSLEPALARVVASAQALKGRWWVIGSAAVVLHGAVTPVADLDLLCEDEADARTLIAALDGRTLTGGTELFRSAVFGRCEAAPMPVEVMAGLTVRGQPVLLASHEWRRCNGLEVPVPSRTELTALLRRFGRPKDLARAALLAA